MDEVRFTGWGESLDKIFLNRLLRDRCGLSLHEAKDIVDRILEGQHVAVSVQGDAIASELVRDASAIGAICHVISDKPADSRAS